MCVNVPSAFSILNFPPTETARFLQLARDGANPNERFRPKKRMQKV